MQTVAYTRNKLTGKDAYSDVYQLAVEKLVEAYSQTSSVKIIINYLVNNILSLLR